LKVGEGMKRFKKVAIALGAFILVVGISWVAYYIYESMYYFSTEDASVTADMVTITPEITGKIKRWEVGEGDYVKAGQVLGSQDISSLINSSAINP